MADEKDQKVTDKDFEDFIKHELDDELDVNDVEVDDPEEETEDESDLEEESDEDVEDNDETVDDEVDEPDDESEPEPETNLNPDLVEQNKQLLALVKNLTSAQAKPEPKKEVEPEKDLSEEKVFKDVAEILDLDEGESAKFAALLKLMKVQTTETAVSEALKATPNTVKEVVSTQKTMDDIRTQFYKDHPALDGFKSVVGMIAKQVAENNQDESIENIFEQTATEAYKALNIDPKKAKKQNASSDSKTGKKKKPAFANTSSARKQQKKKSGFEQQVDEMLALD